MLKYIKFLCLLILITLIGISYHPSFFGEGDVSFRSGIGTYIIALTIVLTFLSINITVLYNQLICKYFFFLLFLIATYLVLASINFPVTFSDIRLVSIPLAAIVIGYNLLLSRKTYSILILVFAISVIYSSYSQIITNIGGFIIIEQYLIDQKNGLGGLISLSGISVLFLSYSFKEKWKKTLVITFVVFTLVLLLTMRARSATIAYSFVIILHIFRILNQHKPTIKIKLVALSAFTLLFILLMISINPFQISENWVINYVYDSFTLNRKDDISSGRMQRNIEAFKIISQNPLLGNLQNSTELKSVHNYPLRILCEYGLIGGWPLLAIYIMIGYFTCIRIIKLKNIYETDLGYYLIISQFIISLAEPSYPFGPGTVSFFAFLMFGYAIRNDYQRFSILQKRI